MSNVRVLTLDKDQIHQLLSSHELFTDDEVKLAARRKVQLDKKPKIREYPALDYWMYERPRMYGRMYNNPYQSSSLLDGIFGRGLF